MARPALFAAPPAHLLVAAERLDAPLELANLATLLRSTRRRVRGRQLEAALAGSACSRAADSSPPPAVDKGG